jgi:hypothetical protein
LFISKFYQNTLPILGGFAGTNTILRSSSQ